MWSRGDTIRFRYVRDGRAFWTLPATVARDDETELALWIAPGAPMRRPDPPRMPIPQLAAGRWQTVETTWAGEGILMLRRPETRHAIWLFWAADGHFRGWYVNLEDWWRADDGVDAYDHQLDIWVAADGTWHWKDEDDLVESVAVGIFTTAEASKIRAEGERVLAAWPFPTGWEDWRPDPSWNVG
jgi:Protein of unknown function (DUF402)